MVVLRDISFEYVLLVGITMAPIIGRAHIGYLPTDRIVGISEASASGARRLCACRFQVQREAHRANRFACVNAQVLKPRGVGVVIDADFHQCMTTRGVTKRGVSMITSKMLGTFRADASTRAEFLRFIDIEGHSQR